MARRENSNASIGSALLLTVVVISVLTTTTLGAIALSYDQLTSTDKVNNSAVAKLAADSGLARLREKIAAGNTTYPEAFNLSRNQSVTVTGSLASFRPTPRESVYTLESSIINLPRCISVGVLSPWVNDGQYLFQHETQSNPALIFHYANIVNDTPLGIIAESNATSSDDNLNADLKKQTISEFSKLGHFYNPYASIDKKTNDPSYWTIKMGGPQDQFLTRKAEDSSSSFYRNLDFVYVPYLPRFVDSGLLDLAGGGLVRKTGQEMRQLFEQVIRANNFKVWIDGAVTDDLLYQYGLGDLFTDGITPTDANETKYQLSWIQPTLWNDLPEADGESGYASDLMGPYVRKDLPVLAQTDTVHWQRPTKPVKVPGAPDAGWQAQILRGSRSFSFLYPSGDLTRTLDPGDSLNLNLFGSYEGLRLNQKISVVLIDKTTQKPISLQSRSSVDQGQFYNASLSEINPGTNNITLRLSATASDTPNKLNGQPLQLGDLSVIYLKSDVQLATKQSVSGTLQADGQTVTFGGNSCSNTPGAYTVCPAVADVVSLSKAGQKPVWGKVTTVQFDPSDGSQMTGFKLDKFREYPRPLQNMAHQAFTDPADGNKHKIAYYGGAIVAPEHDGSVNSISDELWFYVPNDVTSPADDVWEYYPGAGPGPRAGGSLAHTTITSDRLVLFGGYRYEAIGSLNLAGSPACGDNYYLKDCLYANRPGARVAKIMPNDLWQFDLTTRTWSSVPNPANDASPDFAEEPKFQIKVLSHFDERSGKDTFPRTIRTYTAGPVSLDVSPGGQTNLNISPSIAGLAIGDELKLSGSITNGDWFTGQARVTSFVDEDTIQVRTYGVKSGGAVSLDSLDLQVAHRMEFSGSCFWENTNKSCVISADDINGLAVGDAVALERFNINGSNAANLTHSMSGYISRISSYGANWQVYFISDERLAGVNDFFTGTCDYAQPSPAGCQGESVRHRPYGRYGGTFQVETTNSLAYLWQGAQTDSLSAGRIAETWQLDLATTTWQMNPLTFSPFPSGNLNIETVTMPESATVFTSNATSVSSQTVETCNATDGQKSVTRNQGINVALVKDKWQTRKRLLNVNNQPTEVTECELVWDNNKTWTLEIESEGNNYWTMNRVVNNAQILVERSETFVDGNGRTQMNRQSFYGRVTGLSFPGTSANPGTNLRIDVVHVAGDYEGITTNSANTSIQISYPNSVNANGLVITNLIGANNDNVRSSNIGLASQIPAGASVVIYRTSQTFTTGTTTLFYTGIVDTRQPIISGGSVSSLNIGASGFRFFNTPNAMAYGANHLAGDSASNNLVFAHYGHFRLRNSNWSSEWYTLASDNQWRARISERENNNRPPPRINGAIARSYNPEYSNPFILLGGTAGPYTSLWAAKSPEDNTAARWLRSVGSPKAEDDLPNLYGAAFDMIRVANDDETGVVFGGRRDFTNRAPFGPKVLGPAYNTPTLGDSRSCTTVQPTNPSDRSFSLAGCTPASTHKAAQLTDMTATQNTANGLPNTNNSFKISHSATSLNMTAGSNNSVCQFVGETICKQLTVRHLGTLGRWNMTAGSSLAIINPGGNFRYQGVASNTTRSLILGGPAVSLTSTNNRWDFDGYYPYTSDSGNYAGYGSNDYNTGAEYALEGTKALLLAGFTKLTAADFPAECSNASACGSILITPAGVGKTIASGAKVSSSYCATYTLSGSTYSCQSDKVDARRLSHIPDAEDLVFMFNAAKMLSGDEAYKITGFYGGVRRGYLVNERAALSAGGELEIKEIVP